jgi:hypothetical protein
MTIAVPQSQVKPSVRYAEPCAIMIFSVAGDLTKRLLQCICRQCAGSSVQTDSFSPVSRYVDRPPDTQFFSSTHSTQ